MLKDITIGQYFPSETLIHRLDPRIKIILTIAYVISLFLISNAIGFLISILFIFFCYVLSKIPFKMILKSIKPIIPILIFTALLNMFFIDGDVIFKFWVFKITTQGIKMAIIMAVRILCLIIGTSLLTYTTSPIELTDAIERLLKPLKLIRFPVHEMAMMMTIALRFIPTLIEETDKIMSAQKARGADMETGGLIKRAKAIIPVLIPLFVSAFRRADELALAMECRCYNGGDGRTKMKQLHISLRDIFSIFIVAVFITSIILINIYVPVVF